MNSTADRILALLEQQRGEFISGEDMAEGLSISRNSIWKSVKALRERGYEIEAATNRGYRLKKESSALSLPGIEQRIRVPNVRLRLFDELDSTNAELRREAENGADEGLVVIALTQTAGRGRLGRSFASPSGGGLYMSLLLRPQIEAEEATLITTAAAVAVCEAIERTTEKKPGIKWVNDIFLDGRKVCGILTEGSFGIESGRLDYVVVGIGINVLPPKGGFPEELREIAGAVLSGASGDVRGQLAAEVINSFFDWYARLGTAELAEEYRKRSIITGREITVLAGGGAREATAVSIDDRCRLLVRYSDGAQELLSSGEISVRLKD